MRLSRTDLEAILAFLADVSDLDFDELYPVDFLYRLQDLVPSDAITYQESDRGAQCIYAGVGIPPDDEDGGEEMYWSTGPCPITQYRERTGSVDTVRMSDVISRRRYHELPIYRDYFRPYGVDQMIDLGLPASPRRHRSFLFFRRLGARDFGERDRSVLEMLRPHMYRLEGHAALRRQLGDALRKSNGDADGSMYADLTPREREIVELVAEGKTNAEIAAQLWVAPSTVKKHLEHVYAKIGVGRRAAVAAGRYPARA